MGDRRLSVRYIAAVVGISHGPVETILHHHLRLSKVSARWVPRMPKPKQKADRVAFSRSSQDRFQSDPEFLNLLITQDETWVSLFDLETKTESRQWKHSSPSLEVQSDKISLGSHDQAF